MEALDASVIARFWRKVDRSGGPNACWPWKAGTHHFGHGAFRIHKTQVQAHRVAYALIEGPVRDDIDVLHTCDNPPCCNPAHLYLGTQADNNRDRTVRGRAVNILAARNKAKRRCANGHPFTRDNTLAARNANGRLRRACRECQRIAHRAWARSERGREYIRQKNKRQYERRKLRANHCPLPA